VVGRDSGEVRLEVIEHADQATLEEEVEGTTLEGTTVYTDEWCGYAHLPERHRGHATVCHAAGEWARDDDGDGVREVHDNTLEGIWTGLRNFLRMFRGVSKWYLAQYVAIFQWSYNTKRVTDDFLRCLLGVPSSTALAS
jgi:transposase